MKATIRERIDLLLPTRVTRFELVDNHHPIMRTDVITLEITGPFVGCQGVHSLWEEVEPSVLASHLKRFEGQDLLAVESGPGWLHRQRLQLVERLVEDDSAGDHMDRDGLRRTFMPKHFSARSNCDD